MFGLFGKKKEKKHIFSIKKPKHLIIITPASNIRKTNIKYPLIEPFAYANIRWEQKRKSLVYYVLEPELNEKEKQTRKKIQESVSEIIDVKISVIKNTDEAIKYILDKADKVIDELGIELSKKTYEKIMYYIIRDFVGLNEIEPLLRDPYIEDIGCTGLNTPVYIIHKKFGSLETNIVYTDFDMLSNFVIKIAERCGRYISYATPLLDGSLPDGSRVQASLAKDVTTKGPTFSIRKFRRNPFSPTDLLNLKTVSLDMLAYLWMLIQYNTSVLICGGVSTGKTTMLNVLSMFIPRESKIISIEDTREINLPHENWIPSVARTGFGVPDSSGKRYGEVDLFDLLKESFRQNPDYVVVGEIRGKEAYVMFQGMASGHPSLGTIHAGSVEDVMKRLETPPIELSPSLIESLDVVIVMTNAKEKGKSARRVKEVVEIQNIDQRTGTAHTKEIFVWIPSEDVFRETLSESEVLQRISFQEGIPFQILQKEMEERKKILSWMQRKEITDFDKVCEIINLYYKDKKTLMNWVNKNKIPSFLKSSLAVNP
ncbi:MAG: secretion system protein E [Candidatus Aenigmatarchaeota archaeon]|nr:MAG: secretion system protein E [Candidatus Aenigmarchaeota archaeon]RLJ07975.1 MAG: secretion system protein E [Candidatus Aenigmarchaeota archaeon]